MTPEMLKEAEEMFKKHLPAQLSETLQKELKRLQDCEQRMTELDRLCNQQREKISILEKKEKTAQEFDNTERNLQVKLKDLETRERNLEIEILKYQLASEQGNKTFAREVALGLVRNTVYKDNVFRNELTGIDFQPNGTQTRYRTGDSENRETKAE